VAVIKSEQRMVWLAAGLVGGLCVSYFWPHEPAMSAASDRNSKFGMATCAVTSGLGVAGELEGIFVLDYYTGRLTGATLDPKSGKFMSGYFRAVAADFQVDPKAEPNYAMVTGKAPLNAKGRTPMASGVIYVGELSSGKILAYGFPFAVANRPTEPLPLDLLDGYTFREKQ
jgi:hypothetical protein